MQKNGENKAITIYDIAKEAGVSPATVSRVLSNRANVSSDKKEKVLELIRKYNFQPNILAKGLANASTKTIGIMVADVRNPFYASLFVACETAAREKGYTVTLSNSMGVKSQEIELLGKMKEQRVDAIIQIGGGVDALSSDIEYVEAVNQIAGDIPFVTTGKLDGTGCYMVRIDDRKCIDLLMNHLLERNHQRIALVGGRMDVVSTYDKYQRYKQVLREYMLEIDKELVSWGNNYGYEDGYQAMKKLIDNQKVPSAVIVVNDQSATGVIRCLQDHGYKIPEDITVVSQDNTIYAEIVTPKLTSVAYDYEKFGKTLVDTVIALLEGKNVDRLQMVEPVLVERESSCFASE